jgi:hypothetical protein
MTTSGSAAERKDLDMYISGVRIAMGDISESLLSDAPDKAYLSYVQAGQAAVANSFNDYNTTQKENPSTGPTTGFNYERWLTSGTSRKVTGDFLLGHQAAGHL